MRQTPSLFSELWRSYRPKLTILGNSCYIPQTKAKKSGKYTWIMMFVIEYSQLRSFKVKTNHL